MEETLRRKKIDCKVDFVITAYEPQRPLLRTRLWRRRCGERGWFYHYGGQTATFLALHKAMEEKLRGKRLIADAIIERQLQKIISGKKYSGADKDIQGEEKWQILLAENIVAVKVCDASKV